MLASTAAPGKRRRLESCAVRVELDIFSGRPNPTWTLSAGETAELKRRLADLPPSAKAPQPPPLGYRGFVMTRTGGVEGDLDLPQAVRVFAGVLEVEQDRRTEHLRDEERIEEWLQTLARARGCWPPFAS